MSDMISKEDVLNLKHSLSKRSVQSDIVIPLSILDAIKTEIKEEAECAYADFERYKVEYLGQDWEDVLDSLPQDDFRYGMERAVEIINKHIVKEH